MKKNNDFESKSTKFWNVLLLYPVALILLFEEWGWEPLANFAYRISRLPFLIRLESKIILLPPWGVFITLCIPLITLLPFKILALYFFGTGRIVVGAIVLISAKVVGTAFFARLFQLTKPVLMQISWFAHWYWRWKNWKDRLLIKVKNSFAWLILMKIKSNVKTWRSKISR